MSDMYYYKLNLTPVGSFYFGGEKKFNPAGEEKANYLVVSRLFPQQTSLLGMLRYALLFKLLKVNGSSEMSEPKLIGECGFGAPAPWGIIERLSEVRVEKDGVEYVEAGLDCQRVDGDDWVRYAPVLVEGGTYMNNRALYRWKNYDPKKPFRHYLCPAKADSAGEMPFLSYDDVFQACPRPGNQKSRDGEAADNAFYKQTRYRLKPGFSFCFYIQVSRELVKPGEGECRVMMGGDQSVFELMLKKEECCPDVFLKPAGRGCGIVRLLSDTSIKEVDEENVLLSIAEKTDFRFIKTQVTDKEKFNYSALEDNGSRGNSPVLCEKQRLFTRGSVFYCGDVGKFTDAIDAQEDFCNVGYNRYTVEVEKVDGLKLLYLYSRHKLEKLNQ